MENDRQFANLEDALLGLRPTPARDPHKAARARAAYLSEARRLQAISRKPLARLNERIAAFFASRLRLSGAFIPLALLAVFLAVTAGTAYAAQGALPGERLYPAKLFVEDLRLVLAVGSENELALHLAFAEERVGELERLQAEGQADGEVARARFAYHTQAAEQLLTGLEAEQGNQERLEKVMSAYQSLLPDAPDERPTPEAPPHSPAAYATPVLDPEVGSGIS